jgi:apolipoprotein N-acyltransferase
MLPIILSVVSGVLLILSQSSFNLGYLGWFCLVPLFIALNGKNLRSSFFYGFITGITCFSGLLYWLFPVSLPNTIFGAALLIIYLSLFFACFCFLFRFSNISFRSSAVFSPLRYVFSASVLWVSFEYLRTLGVLGFPWGLLAYSQWKNSVLIQIADITGVYGVSFLIVLFNAALAYVIYQYRRPFDIKRISSAGMAVLSIVLVGIITFVFFYGMKSISKYEPLINHTNETIDVALIQGNVEQSKKWESDYLKESLGTYMGLTGGLKGVPDLIVWPETAITVSMNENKSLEDTIRNFAKSTKTYFLSGVQETEGGKYYNSVIFISPEGEVLGKYNKIHLVPFGEATPFVFKWIFPFLKKVIPGEDFTPGTEYKVFELSHPFQPGACKFSCCVCFESIFPREIRRFTKNGAQFIINVTNDAWFGSAGASYQHFLINTFRAVENRIEIAQCANSGISGYINMAGQPRCRTSAFTRNVVSSDVKLRTGETFYTRFGDVFSWVCLIASFVFMKRRME